MSGARSARVAEDVHGHDGGDAPTRRPLDERLAVSRALLGEERTNEVGIEIHELVAADEDGMRAQVCDRVHGGDERERGNDDRVLGAHAREPKRDVDGRRAVHARDGVRSARRRLDGLLEAGDERAAR